MVKSDDVLYDLQEGVEAILRESLGVDDEQALAVAESVREHFRMHWGGQNIYFKKSKDMTERDDSIREKFNGANVNELAREFDLTIQTIYVIIKNGRNV